MPRRRVPRGLPPLPVTSAQPNPSLGPPRHHQVQVLCFGLAVPSGFVSVQNRDSPLVDFFPFRGFLADLFAPFPAHQHPSAILTWDPRQNPYPTNPTPISGEVKILTRYLRRRRLRPPRRHCSPTLATPSRHSTSRHGVLDERRKAAPDDGTAGATEGEMG